MAYRFPFGESVKTLIQQDRTPKKIFVLGVNASAVHAKWIRNGSVVCQALAVASEPHIFWDGNPDEAKAIIEKICVPHGAGKLVLPNRNLNGPSAQVLDSKIIAPLGYRREETWLCDLLPQSRLNPNQAKVIKERYSPLIPVFDLNPVTIPLEDGSFCDKNRCAEVVDEILLSGANKLVLLGDIPIKQFLINVCDIKFRSLREYTERYGYAKPFGTAISGKPIEVIPMAHPRQIGGLGRSNAFWFNEHQKWASDIVSN